MLQYKRAMCLSVLFLISFNLIPIALAENEPISISLDCFDTCKGQTMNNSNNILFELTIKNNLDYWASIEGGRDGASLNVVVSNDKLNNGKEYEIYSNILGQSFFIKPRDIIKVYIPFKMYNNKFKDDRLGEWRISPRLFFGNIKFYRNPSDSNNVNNLPFVNSPITGNDLKFNVEKPETKTEKLETKVQEGKSSDIVPKGFVDNIFNFINSNFIITIITAILGPIIVYKYMTRGGRRRR